MAGGAGGIVCGCDVMTAHDHVTVPGSHGADVEAKFRCLLEPHNITEIYSKTQCPLQELDMVEVLNKIKQTMNTN